MRNIYVLMVLLSLLVFTSCDEQEMGFENEGVIIEQDFTRCFCCGGWYIEIESQNYLFKTLPENSNLNLENETLPLSVILKWRKAENPCRDFDIIVENIRKKE